MRPRSIRISVTSAVIALPAIWAVILCIPARISLAPSGPREPFSLGAVLIKRSAFIPTTGAKGYFAEEGLDLYLGFCDLGLLAVMRRAEKNHAPGS